MLAQRILTRMSVNKIIKNLSIARCTTAQAVVTGTSTYEGDGKTSVSILNQEIDGGLMINSFSQMGFRLNNGIMVIGPMAIFPK